MLDVHAPEHRLSGMRDFVVHLLTITAGLLIALALENAAEAFHHHHLQKEAKEEIRQEISSNRAALADRRDQFKSELETMTQAVAILEARSEGGAGSFRTGATPYSESEMDEAAWRTANSSGALGYMEYGEASGLSSVYKEQDLLQKADEQALDDYLQLDVFESESGEISPSKAAAALPIARRALAHLREVLVISRTMMQDYDQALRAK